MKTRQGIPEADLNEAVDLYWEAFSGKLGKVMGPEQKAKRFIRRVLRPDHAICAHNDDGRLLGIAGFKTAKGALVGGDFADLHAIYGFLSACWRATFLHLLERDTENERFLMDGIFVARIARGQGVGTDLLRAIQDLAQELGYKEVRLDVIDTNQRARALYERQGFRAINTTRIGPLRYIFGFSTSTTMVRPVSASFE